jgi:RNA polymerase sigma factor (sigma-70 family)
VRSVRDNSVTPKEFSEQIHSHLGILHKICRTYKRDPDDRDDLFQEIVYNAWKSYPRFEGRSKFSTWLYRVALNTALYQNRKDRFFGKTVDLEVIQHHVAAETKDDNTDLLWLAINKLDELEKSIVVLYLEELPYKEISEITGLTENNIAVKLTRIKSKMKKILEDYGA